eukprot:GHRR01001930.1.p1 GENE.GHRR01001930.1~~GHRR01001930.1.p1  ORF type:complete len:165 (+),score=45.49 GHRR01001930.1:1361-1855(+)
MASRFEQPINAKRIREAFVVFEHKEGSKLVDAKEVPTIVRTLGINPTTQQLQILRDKITAAAAPDTGSYVALENCEGIIAGWLSELKDSLVRDDYHVLMRAFRALDPESRGFIDSEHLKTVLMLCEDGLSPEEINNMISASADDQGRVMYQEYALKLATDGKAV